MTLTSPATEAADGVSMAALFAELGTPPSVVSFESVDPVLTPQGHRIRPLVDGREDGNAPGIEVCAGGLDVPGGFIANPHRHVETDVIVLVYECGDEGALTLFGPSLQFHAVQRRGQVLPIQKGWPHTVVNLSLTTPIRAYEFRSNRTVVLDNPLLPDLHAIAEQRGREFLAAVHGREVIERLGVRLAQPSGVGSR